MIFNELCGWGTWKKRDLTSFLHSTFHKDVRSVQDLLASHKSHITCHFLQAYPTKNGSYYHLSIYPLTYLSSWLSSKYNYLGKYCISISDQKVYWCKNPFFLLLLSYPQNLTMHPVMNKFLINLWWGGKYVLIRIILLISNIKNIDIVNEIHCTA